VQQNTNPIRIARDRADISQVTLCLRSRLSLSTIRNAERGLATKTTLAAIARALSVSVDTLTGRKELPPCEGAKSAQA
jgi:transcriptional regulator with XRE-family HTH domain